VTLSPACAACGTVIEQPLDGPVCGECWQAVCPPASPAAGRDAAASHGGGSDAALAYVAADYRGPLRDIIHAFKYEGRRTLARPLARLMIDAGGAALDGAHCVVPVPLHPLKRMRRGFNQASDLARHLGPPVVHALWRVRLRPPQVGLPAGERRRNVRGAFVASRFLSARRREQRLANRVVVLVDDVRTTGATLEECARVLASMGAGEVRGLTLAQAPLD
jgi:ComF family protein